MLGLSVARHQIYLYNFTVAPQFLGETLRLRREFRRCCRDKVIALRRNCGVFCLRKRCHQRVKLERKPRAGKRWPAERFNERVISAAATEGQLRLLEFNLEDIAGVEIEPAREPEVYLKIGDVVIVQCIAEGDESLLRFTSDVFEMRVPCRYHRVLIAANL